MTLLPALNTVVAFAFIGALFLWQVQAKSPSAVAWKWLLLGIAFSGAAVDAFGAVWLYAR